jgi:hypothetical protein
VTGADVGVTGAIIGVTGACVGVTGAGVGVTGVGVDGRQKLNDETAPDLVNFSMIGFTFAVLIGNTW